mgnify:CR=1 FL=1
MKTRPIRVDGDLAYVTLTQGYEAVINASDAPLVAGWNWYAIKDGNTVYAQRSRPAGERRIVRMHRVLMGDPDGLLVDHRDGDGLNNIRSNLRLATCQQNVHNARISKSNTSGFKGVSWRKTNGKWHAQIRLNGRQRNLGYFQTPEAAHDAYCKASSSLHGEFGRTT